MLHYYLSTYLSKLLLILHAMFFWYRLIKKRSFHRNLSLRYLFYHFSAFPASGCCTTRHGANWTKERWQYPFLDYNYRLQFAMLPLYQKNKLTNWFGRDSVFQKACFKGFEDCQFNDMGITGEFGNKRLIFTPGLPLPHLFVLDANHVLPSFPPSQHTSRVWCLVHELGNTIFFHWCGFYDIVKNPYWFE